MNPIEILHAVTTAISVAKQLIDVGKDVAPIIGSVYNLLAKSDEATQTDLDALREMSDAWSAEIQKPLPPEEE